MSDNTIRTPECRTAADSRREFACTSEPVKRQVRQVPDQGTIYGQASLLDCIAEGAEHSRSADSPQPPARTGMHLGPSRRELADAVRQSSPQGDFIDLPDDDSPFHCRRCSRKFQPGQLDYFTGMCAECDAKTAVQLYR